MRCWRKGLCLKVLQPVLMRSSALIQHIELVAHWLELKRALGLGSCVHELIHVSLAHHSITFEALINDCSWSLRLSLKRSVLLSMLIELGDSIPTHRTICSSEK